MKLSNESIKTVLNYIIDTQTLVFFQNTNDI